MKNLYEAPRLEHKPPLQNQVQGMQHKYRETLLFFATEAQYCHSFCTYCFRWAQFTAVGSSQQFASKDSKKLRDYLRANRYYLVPYAWSQVCPSF